jgi:hypothetical protein
MTYTQYLEKVQEDVLEGIKESQETTLKNIASFRELAVAYPTTLPAFPKLEGYPNATELIEKSFEFTHKLIDLRKDYAIKFAEIVETAQKQVLDATVRQTKSAKHN